MEKIPSVDKEQLEHLHLWMESKLIKPIWKNHLAESIESG